MGPKGLQTRSNIVKQSLQLFSVKGYYNTSVSDILAATGLTKGGLYGHFARKEEIWHAAYLEGIRIWKSIVFKGIRNRTDPLKRLEKFIEMAIEMQNNIHQQTGHILGCPFGNLATELATQDETIRVRLDHLFNRLQKLIRDTLQEAIDRGDRESLDVDATANAFLAYFEVTLMLAKTHNDPQIVRQLLPAAAKIQL